MGEARILVHGGAGLIDDERLPDCIDGCERAADAGARFLGDGALAAVVAAVKSLEENPAFNAGLGATLTREGTVELDAAVMTGDLRFGAVGACPPVSSAVELARAVMEDGEYSVLVADGAAAFAKEVGIDLLGPDDLIIDRVQAKLEAEIAKRRQGLASKGAGTVGAVAVGRDGSLAAATSTGGILYKRIGRVGDTPLIGGGTYADSLAGGAASATGHGESILKVLLTRVAVESLREGLHPEEAGARAMAQLSERVNGEGGLILIDAEGRTFAGKNTRHMPWASGSVSGSISSGS